MLLLRVLLLLRAAIDSRYDTAAGVRGRFGFGQRAAWSCPDVAVLAAGCTAALLRLHSDAGAVLKAEHERRGGGRAQARTAAAGRGGAIARVCRCERLPPRTCCSTRLSNVVAEG